MNLRPVAIDATYAVGPELSGVGIYSRELIEALRRRVGVRLYYRPHRWRHAMAGVQRGVFGERWMLPWHRGLFHGLNQRLPKLRFRAAVCTFHDLFVLTAEYSAPEFRQRFAAQAREAARKADVVVCVSAFTAGQVHELLGVPRERLRVVHHGVRKLQVPDAVREPVVLTTGAIQARKNTLRLVKAFSVLPPPWRLVLAGSPGGYGAQDVLDAVANSPVRSRIEIAGYVSDGKLASLYARASIFAFVSLDEGFGMPVLEAMAAGVPVIASNTSAIPEICGDAAVYVDPHREESVAAELVRVAAAEALREDLRTKGFSRASGFTWDRAADQTLAAYRELLPL
ncbi:MAG TPA: glycosyltransferase family 1 protein [Bryobacteraceae bacterium]|nr:glycosyltransferase family 1 protein [Bryobacteraceae bacterium]